MELNPSLTAALIGAAAALSVVVVKDVLLESLRRRADRSRESTKRRVDTGYQPVTAIVEELAWRMRQGKPVEDLQEELRRAIRSHGHLLSGRREADIRILANAEIGAEISIDDVTAIGWLLRRERDELKQLVSH